MTFHRLVAAVCVLTFVVIVLGAWVRLTHAGLGCPDWPGCYGAMTVPEHAADTGKAWREMIHRYAAAALGLLVFAVAAVAWLRRHRPGQPLGIPLTLVALVVFQSLLGMWTVTLLLKPVVVMAHLLGGFAILALSWWLLLRSGAYFKEAPSPPAGLRGIAVTAVIVVTAQVALGGWTSANYAALACPDFPACQAQWWPDMDFREGFVLWRGTGVDYEGGRLDSAARTAIHMTHRLGALVTFLFIGALSLSLRLRGERTYRRLGTVIGTLLLLQVALGVLTVLRGHPLALAVAHNAGAALLLLATVTILYVTSASRRMAPRLR